MVQATALAVGASCPCGRARSWRVQRSHSRYSAMTSACRALRWRRPRISRWAAGRSRGRAGGVGCDWLVAAMVIVAASVLTGRRAAAYHATDAAQHRGAIASLVIHRVAGGDRLVARSRLPLVLLLPQGVDD